MKVWLILALVLSTSACSTFNSEFDCPPSKGVGCKRLSAINEDYNHKMEMVTETPPKSGIYTKSDHLDIFMQGYDDAAGRYHHPKKITIKS